MHEKLKEGLAIAQEVLNSWARTEGLIEEGETVLLDAWMLSQEDVMRMRVQEFFTRERIMKAGASKNAASRIEVAIRWSSLNKVAAMSMAEFLRKHSMEGIVRSGSIGKKSAEWMVATMNQAGLVVKSVDELF